MGGLSLSRIWSAIVSPGCDIMISWPGRIARVGEAGVLIEDVVWIQRVGFAQLRVYELYLRLAGCPVIALLPGGDSQ